MPSLSCPITPRKAKKKWKHTSCNEGHLGPDGEGGGRGKLAEGGHNDKVVVEGCARKDANRRDGKDFCDEKDIRTARERLELVCYWHCCCPFIISVVLVVVVIYERRW